jgi:signal transduction histidine kinase
MNRWWSFARLPATMRGSNLARDSGACRCGAADASSDARQSTMVAIHAERARIYGDLHDDIGARLVSIMSASSEERIRELARAALQDLREVVYHARGEPGTLEQVLGEIRAELAQRLEYAGWQLLWHAEDLPEVVLSGDRTIHVYRILREATTNAIKYAAQGVLRVRVRHLDGMVYLDITDQGGPDEVLHPEGNGQRGMRDRAERLGGELRIGPGTLCGTKVVLRFPLTGS